MDKLADTNKFIELVENLYDAKFLNNNVDDAEEEKPAEKIKPGLLDIFKKKEPPVEAPPDVVLLVYNELKKYLDNILSNPSQTFWNLWQICQFIRWAEKVFLYNNDPDKENSIFVDSEMNADERHFKITLPDVNIFFILKLVKIPNATLVGKQYSEVISIKIERNYGKKMNTKIQVVDGDIELADDSDLYLLNQINRYINTAIRTLFIVVASNIVGEEIVNNNPIVNGFYGV